MSLRVVICSNHKSNRDKLESNPNQITSNFIVIKLNNQMWFNYDLNLPITDNITFFSSKVTVGQVLTKLRHKMSNNLNHSLWTDGLTNYDLQPSLLSQIITCWTLMRLKSNSRWARWAMRLLAKSFSMQVSGKPVHLVGVKFSSVFVRLNVGNFVLASKYLQ